MYWLKKKVCCTGNISVFEFIIAVDVNFFGLTSLKRIDVSFHCCAPTKLPFTNILFSLAETWRNSLDDSFVSCDIQVCNLRREWKVSKGSSVVAGPLILLLAPVRQEHSGEKRRCKHRVGLLWFLPFSVHVLNQSLNAPLRKFNRVSVWSNDIAQLTEWVCKDVGYEVSTFSSSVLSRILVAIILLWNPERYNVIIENIGLSKYWGK